jgi:glycosyltransferase involved in cell wall biosynthesis
MKVSVIVPTFNRAHLVAQTVDSILGQTFRDFELIVVDDCSQDDTEKVITACTDERIRYFRHDSGRLVAVNRNYGMEHARGEFIAFCDDDDLWLPEKLERQLREYDVDADIGMVCSNGIAFSDTGDLGLMHDYRITGRSFTLKSLLRYNPVITSSVVLKKNVIDDIGGMNTDPVFRSGQDFELWLRVSRKYEIRYLSFPLVKCRKHSQHLKFEGVAAVKRSRKIYRWLLRTDFIGRGLYWRLVLRSLPIEFLLRTRTMPLASWLWRSLRKIIRS